MGSFSRKYGNSPVFSSSPTLTTGQQILIDYEVDTFNGKAGSAKRFIPFNSLRVVNASGQTIQIYFNQHPLKVRTINAGQTTTITDYAFSNLKIINIGSGSIGANTLFLEALLESPDSTEAIYDILRVFNGEGQRRI